MHIKKEKSRCHVKTELGEDKEERNNLYSNRVHKITLKAHFQLPNASGHEFKPKAGCSGSKKINSNQFVFLSDLHGFLEQLCSTTMCGVFDQNSPPAIRMLDYLGDTGKYCTRSNVLSSLPSEFVNISRDMVIDVGVCNLKSAASMCCATKKRKLITVSSSSSLSSSNQVIDIRNVSNNNGNDSDVDDEECVFLDPASKVSYEVKYNKTMLPIKYELDTAIVEPYTIEVESSNSSSQDIGKTSSRVILWESTSSFQVYELLKTRFIIYVNLLLLLLASFIIGAKSRGPRL